jgi:flagellar biosynthesis/type III secretory pathway M-ring protein FliF/YscJ
MTCLSDKDYHEKPKLVMTKDQELSAWAIAISLALSALIVLIVIWRG